MKLLKQLSVIAGFSIIGEIISYLLKELLDIFIPGSLIGMIILFILSSASSKVSHTEVALSKALLNRKWEKKGGGRFQRFLVLRNFLRERKMILNL